MIEKVIDRCLQKDPAQRPESALQVAAALPGGDPLAAALAAGETPSPKWSRPRRRKAHFDHRSLSHFQCGKFCCAVRWITKYAFVYRLAPITSRPNFAREGARLDQELGYNDVPLDTADGITLIMIICDISAAAIIGQTMEKLASLPSYRFGTAKSALLRYQ